MKGTDKNTPLQRYRLTTRGELKGCKKTTERTSLMTRFLLMKRVGGLRNGRAGMTI